MKERIKKFYHDHEEAIISSCIAVSITTIVVARLVDDANKIVSVHGAKDEDRYRILIEKKNGNVRNFSIPLEKLKDL